MHERPLYYVFALFVACILITLINPAIGDDGETNIESVVVFTISANNTFFDVTSPVQVKCSANLSGGSPEPDSLQWTLFTQTNPLYNQSGYEPWPASDNYTFPISEPDVYGLSCTAYNATHDPVPAYNTASHPLGYIIAYNPISANFTNTTTTGVLPLKVMFTNNSTGHPNDWAWQFTADNLQNQTGTPVNWTYTTNGTFRVNMTAWNRSSYFAQNPTSKYYYKYGWVNGSVSRDITIVSKEKLTPRFNTTISTFTGQAKGQVPLHLLFSDNSTGDDINYWNWTFGDGNFSSAQDPAEKIYSTPGLYNVSLEISSPWIQNVSATRIHYVNAYMPISANFTSDPTSECEYPVFPAKYTFTPNATQTGHSIPDAFNWSFDDGTVNDTNRSAIHQFNLPGLYNVTLTTLNTTHDINISERKQIQVTGIYANFTADPMIGYQNTTNQPIQVNFTYNATDVVGATSLRWDFGNGDGTYSFARPVSTTYTRPGNFTVRLTANNSCGESNSTEKVIQIIERPVANFSWQPSYGNFPLKVQFTDTSTDTPNWWEWDFGDGSAHNLTRNPVHPYASAGQYSVTLKVGNDTVTPLWLPAPVTKIITLSEGINVDFTANRTRGAAPLDIQFNESPALTPLITNREWNFNDSTPKVSTKDPVHRFNGVGNYTVNFTAWNTTTGARGSKEMRIEVVSPLVANFEPQDRVRMNASVGVQFTDLSEGNITNYTWNFGDGNTSSYRSPLHVFPRFQKYNVSLTVNNTYYDISDTLENALNVTEMREPFANFTADPLVIDPQGTVYFTSRSEGPDLVNYLWNFGDGETLNGTSATPQHQYLYPGIYNVSLTVTNDLNQSDTKTRLNYISVRGLIPSFVTEPAGWAIVNTPVVFRDTSRGNPVQWTWDFGDDSPVTTTTQSTITHVYGKNGPFPITMTATNWEPRSGSAYGSINITNKTVPQNVDFDIPEMKYSGRERLEVQFVDNTPEQFGVIDRLWEFGDGSNSFEESPKHTYTKPGEYTVTLTVRNEVGTNAKRRVALVTVI